MTCARLGFMGLLLFAAQAFGQEAKDLSNDPRLQQKVDVHLKRVLMPKLIQYLKAHTDQKFILDQEIDPLMICVFAKNQPLWLVMEDVAEALGAKWKDLQSEWRLAFRESPRSLYRDTY